MGNNSIGDVLTIPHFELLNLDKTTKNNIEKVILVMKYNGNIPVTCRFPHSKASSGRAYLYVYSYQQDRR